jgi:hypothetical protein
MRVATVFVSAVTCLVSGWMAVMYLALRHPDFGWRVALAGLIFAGAAALGSGLWRGQRPLRAGLGLWAAAMAVLGSLALGGGGDDGWTIVAGGEFLAEGVIGVIATARG